MLRVGLQSTDRNWCNFLPPSCPRLVARCHLQLTSRGPCMPHGLISGCTFLKYGKGSYFIIKLQLHTCVAISCKYPPPALARTDIMRSARGFRFSCLRDFGLHKQDALAHGQDTTHMRVSTEKMASLLKLLLLQGQ